MREPARPWWARAMSQFIAARSRAEVVADLADERDQMRRAGRSRTGTLGPLLRYCIEYRIHSMPVRLNITIDQDVHERLKRDLPPKGISRFINDALRARLRPSREQLDTAYRAAAREKWRRSETREWAGTDVEGWPE